MGLDSLERRVALLETDLREHRADELEFWNSINTKLDSLTQVKNTWAGVVIGIVFIGSSILGLLHWVTTSVTWRP